MRNGPGMAAGVDPRVDPGVALDWDPGMVAWGDAGMFVGVDPGVGAGADPGVEEGVDPGVVSGVGIWAGTLGAGPGESLGLAGAAQGVQRLHVTSQVPFVM